MIERNWKIGEDLNVKDSLLDGFTFEQLIIALRSGSKSVDILEINRVVNEMLEIQLQDMKFLIENNIEEIIRLALEGRELCED